MNFFMNGVKSVLSLCHIIGYVYVVELCCWWWLLCLGV